MTETITTKTENLPACATGTWGAAEQLEQTDLLVPKIWQMQAMSKLVADGAARPGDFVDSLTGELLKKKEEVLSVIVWGSYKQMLISKLSAQNKWELERVEQITHENAAHYALVPFTEEVEGVKYKNALQYNYMCLVEGRLNYLPYILSLTSTKTRAARKWNTMLSKLAQLKRPSAAVVFDLRSVQEQNEQGHWYGLDVAQGRDCTAAEIEIAHQWYQRSKSQKIAAAEPSAGVADASDDIPF